jgi:hypothetical protein
VDNETKEALLRSRPWAPTPEEDQHLSRAAAADPNLAKLLEQQQRLNTRLHDELAAISIPNTLRDQILARPKIIRVSAWRKSQPFLAIAAAIVLIAGGLFYWLPAREDTSVAGFRSRMVGFAVREYRMDLFTNDPATLNRYLAAKGDPTQFRLPQKLQSLPLKGGASLTWQGKPVSMICFDWSPKETLYMFVLDQPLTPATTAQTQPLKGLNTATWTADGKTFILAGRIPEQNLAELVRS